MDFFGGKYSQVLCSQAFVQCKVVFWIFFLLDYNLLLSFVFFMVTAVIFNFKSVLMRPYNWNATIVGQNEFWIWKLQLWDLRNSKTQDWTGKLLAEGKSKQTPGGWENCNLCYNAEILTSAIISLYKQVLYDGT